MPKGCDTVTFKRRSATSKVLPKSKWVTVKRCEGRSLSTSAKRRFKHADVCRRGGTGWKTKYRAQLKSGRTPTAHIFTSCG
jgi:hypothetical protein